MIQVEQRAGTATHGSSRRLRAPSRLRAGGARRRCGWLADDEREAIFHTDAYLVLLQKEACGDLETIEMHPHQLRAYIVQTAIDEALDKRAGRGAKRRRWAGEGPHRRAGARRSRRRAGAEELASASLDNARLRGAGGGRPWRRSKQTIGKSCLPGAYVWMVMLLPPSSTSTTSCGWCSAPPRTR